ncbi:hypothetical protein [Furfurilactobacillus rossiae]|uniref:hypothetical protein n=1 Tax=Furfurilactobacillus rossiae TaxID=231049 RepID=UPI0002FAAC80|nr:hypothetical protein [Furfurilactobacillus rossiae]QLE61920.1 hypothetical protein LROSRS0_1875 [Furfurilactobacillus rossiae]
MNEKLALAGLQSMQPYKKADWSWHSDRPLRNKLFENIIYRKGDKRKWNPHQA